MEYTYNVTDTLNDLVAPSALHKQIVDASLSKALVGVKLDGTQVYVEFASALDGDQATLDAVVAAHDGVPLPAPAPAPTTATGVPIYMPEPPEGSAVSKLSPNFCDPTTWYSTAADVDDEALTDSGDGLTWSMANTTLIDVHNGKMTQEHALHATHGLVVRVDGVVMTEKTRINGQQGDFSVDPLAGTITFDVSRAGQDVRADYCYMTDSTWIIAPDAGKRLRLLSAEVQFSNDIDLRDSIAFEYWGFVEIFAPPLVDNPFPAGTKINLGALSPAGLSVYHTIQDFVNESQRAYPAIPAVGNAQGSWRGLPQPLHIFEWPYAETATRDLHDAQGAEVRIRLLNNTPHAGTAAYVTLYATEEDE